MHTVVQRIYANAVAIEDYNLTESASKCIQDTSKEHGVPETIVYAKSINQRVFPQDAMKQRRNWRGWTIQQLSAKTSTRSASNKQPRGGATTGAIANIGALKTTNRTARPKVGIEMGRLNDVVTAGAHTAPYVQHFIVVNIFKSVNERGCHTTAPIRLTFREFREGTDGSDNHAQ